MILVGRISLILGKLKHKIMTKIFRQIYWNQAIFTAEAAGEIYVFVYAKPECLVMKGYILLSKDQR